MLSPRLRLIEDAPGHPRRELQRGDDVRDGIIVGTSRIAATPVSAFQDVNGTISAVDVDTGGDSVARSVNAFYHDIVGYTRYVRQHLLAVQIQRRNRHAAGSSQPHGRGEQRQRCAAGCRIPLHDGICKLTRFSSHRVLTDLGTLGGSSSEARAVDYFGDVVGSAQNAAGLPRAFVWRDGHMIDLNTVLAPGSGWVLESAAAIADTQQIVGYGTLKGKRRAFLLTPAVDMYVVPWGLRSEFSSNLPIDGIPVGHHVKWVTSTSGARRRDVFVWCAHDPHPDGTRALRHCRVPLQWKYVRCDTNGGDLLPHPD